MKVYKTGYIAGVFDLFHIGHLNLIRKAKERSEYLIVGVLSDELVLHFKNKAPYIPFQERLEIVLDAWNLYRYDCLFSGDDYVNNESWIRDKKKLKRLGSDIQYFPYTKSTSSTQIKEAMNRG